MLNKRFLTGFIILIFFSILASASLNVSLSDQGTNTRYKSNGSLINNVDLEVSIYDNLAAGNLIYNETFSVAVKNGSWNVMLGENSSNPLQLEFGKKYYKDYKINGEDLDFTDFQGASVERQFFYSPLGDIAEEDVNATTNLTIRNLNATGNASASWFKGLFDWIVGLIGIGSSNNYLIFNGSTLSFNETYLNNTLLLEGNRLGFNSTGYTSGGGDGFAPTVQITSTQWSGNITYDGSYGYKAANKICYAEFTGSHLCTEFEITSWFANTTDTSTGVGDAWCDAGGPKYVPASIPVDSCWGFRYNGTTTHLGNYWHFDSNTGGEGRAINCGSLLNLSCCDYT